MRLISFLLLSTLITLFPLNAIVAEEHEDHAHEEDGAIHLTAAQLKAAGIVVETLQPRLVASELRAPGEIRLNAYATAIVTPRIAAQVLGRNAKLGDHVNKGQPLTQLSSVEMAQAQGDLLVADREWRRVKKLGRDVVSAQRFTKAKVEQALLRARVLAYGMTEAEVRQLLAGKRAADGRFNLLAPRAGTVIRDDFIVGELVEPGRVLFEISDESRLWVEARLTPDQAEGIAPGSPATVLFKDRRIDGKVAQIHHALDESTRTLGVRIEIPNPGDRLHPGLFVEVRIQGAGREKRLAIPTDAVVRSPDGDWQVFIEHEPGEFEAREIEVVRASGGLTVIEGLDPGTRVVTDGAFFLQSEQAKSGFEVHNH